MSGPFADCRLARAARLRQTLQPLAVRVIEFFDRRETRALQRARLISWWIGFFIRSDGPVAAGPPDGKLSVWIGFLASRAVDITEGYNPAYPRSEFSLLPCRP